MRKCKRAVKSNTKDHRGLYEITSGKADQNSLYTRKGRTGSKLVHDIHIACGYLASLPVAL